MDAATIGESIVKLVTDSTNQATTATPLDYAKIANQVAALMNQARHGAITQKPQSLASIGSTSATKSTGSKKVFNFTELPPEIRNQIYGLALTLPPGHWIEVTRRAQWSAWMKDEKKKWQQDKADGKNRRLRTCYLEATVLITVPNKYKTKGVQGHKQRKVMFGGITTANLLLLNRAVHKEATAVLYGSNTFSFYNVPAAEDFVDWVGDQHRLMRKIRVVGYHPDRHASLLSKTLKPLQHMESLQIGLERTFELETLWPQLRAFISGATSTSCSCDGDKKACDCLATRRRARFDAITLGPEGMYVDGNDVLCWPYEIRQFRMNALTPAQRRGGAAVEGTFERRARQLKARLLKEFEADETLLYSPEQQTETAQDADEEATLARRRGKVGQGSLLESIELLREMQRQRQGRAAVSGLDSWQGYSDDDDGDGND